AVPAHAAVWQGALEALQDRAPVAGPARPGTAADARIAVRELVRDRARAVGRGVVHDQQVRTHRRGEDGGRQRGQVLALVQGGDDDEQAPGHGYLPGGRAGVSNQPSRMATVTFTM